MTTALDRKLLPKVAGIIEKYGVLATFKLTGPFQHDPETGEVNPEQPDTKRVKVTPPAQYSVDLQSGSIQPNDAYVYVAADGLPSSRSAAWSSMSRVDPGVSSP